MTEAEELRVLAAQREEIRRLLDCPPSRGDEVVVCGRRRRALSEPYRLPLPSADQPTGPGRLAVELAPGIRVEPDVVVTKMGPANAITVKVKF
jgi:hypothetical protein